MEPAATAAGPVGDTEQHDMSEVQVQPAPKPKLHWYQFSLSSLFWLAIGIALLMGAIVQTTRYQLLDQQRRVAERQVEELKKILPTQIQTGWLTQLSSGPGYLYRGSLPTGDWRLAVYSWHGAPFLNASEIAPPPGLVPLVAKRIPNPEDVEIHMSEAGLPPGMAWKGKPVDIAFNADITDTRPGHTHGSVLSLPPLALLNASSAKLVIANAPTNPKRDHVLIYKGDFSGAGNHCGAGYHYLVLIEPAGPASSKPQIGTDAVDDIP